MTFGQILRRLYPISFAIVALGLIWMTVGGMTYGDKHLFIGMFITLGGVMVGLASFLFGFDTPLDGFSHYEWDKQNRNTRY